MKRFIFRIIDALFFFTAVFFICYAFLLPRMNSRNAALFTSLFAALALDCAYYLIRGIFLERKDARASRAEEIRSFYYGFLLLEQKELFAMLAKAYGQNSSRASKKQNVLFFRPPQNQALICFRPPEGQPAGISALLESLRLINTSNYPELLIIAPFGLEKAAQAFLERLNAKYELINFTQLLRKLSQEGFTLPKLEKPSPAGSKKLSKRLEPLLENKRSPYALIKYAVLLCLLSVFTPFYIYYLAAAGLFLAAGIYIKFRQKRQSRNIF